MTRATGPIAVLAVTALLTLGACAGDEPSAPPPSGPVTLVTTTTAPSSSAASPSTPPSATISASATETAVPEDDTWSLTEQTADFPGGGGALLPVAVRTGAHDGYDRVVFDLTGEGRPGFRVTYVETAIEDPRGEEIDLGGDAVSEIIITGLRLPEESEQDAVLRAGTMEVGELEEVEQIHVSGLFEGQLQVLVGLDAEVPFRVFVLADPARLVVDYQTS